MIDLHIIGDIKVVLEGRVTKKELFTVKVDDIPYGLGAGFFEKEKGICIGEAMIFEKTAYIYFPDQIWPRRELLQTPFMMGITRKPNNFITFHENLTLTELYDKLLLSYPSGFAVIGNVEFTNLKTAYLKTPPIFQENINEYKEKYWQQKNLGKASGKTVGFLLPYLNTKAFYHNPNEVMQNTSYSHTHILVNDGVYHLLSHSMLSSAQLWVEEISKT